MRRGRCSSVELSWHAVSGETVALAKIAGPDRLCSIRSVTPSKFALVVRSSRNIWGCAVDVQRGALARTALPLLPLRHSMPPLPGNVSHECMVQFSCDKVRWKERGVENTAAVVSASQAAKKALVESAKKLSHPDSAKNYAVFIRLKLTLQ